MIPSLHLLCKTAVVPGVPPGFSCGFSILSFSANVLFLWALVFFLVLYMLLGFGQLQSIPCGGLKSPCLARLTLLSFGRKNALAFMPGVSF